MSVVEFLRVCVCTLVLFLLGITTNKDFCICGSAFCTAPHHTPHHTTGCLYVCVPHTTPHHRVFVRLCYALHCTTPHTTPHTRPQDVFTFVIRTAPHHTPHLTTGCFYVCVPYCTTHHTTPHLVWISEDVRGHRSSNSNANHCPSKH